MGDIEQKNNVLKGISTFITSLGLIVCMIALTFLSIGSISCSFLESYTNLLETGNLYTFLENPEIMIVTLVVIVLLFVLSYFFLKFKN